MLSLLIVEDDQMIRRSLREYVRWGDWGMEAVGDVANGRKALEFIKGRPVDIILTDVAMPQMDGIELVRRLRAAGMPVKVLFISGHTDLPYLQKALKLDAVDYIIKPLRMEELGSALTKISGICLAEKKQRETVEKLRHKLEESMPILRERFISALLQRCVGGREYTEQELLFLGLPFAWDDRFTVISMDTSAPGRNDEGNAPPAFSDARNTEMGLLSLSSGQLRLREPLRSSFFLVEDVSICVCVLSSRDSLPYERSLEVAGEIQRNFCDCTGRRSAVGIGREVEGIENLHFSYTQSRKALEQRYFLGSDAIIHISDLEKTDIKVGMDMSAQMEAVIDNIRLGKKEETEQAVDRFFLAVRESDTVDIRYVKNMCVELAVLAEKEFLELKISDHPRRQGRYLWSTIQAHTSFDETWRWLRTQFGEMADMIRSVKSTTVRNLTEMMLRFVQENYRRDITIHTLAEEFYITSNYVCLLFKKETGITFIDYLTRVRVEKAKELLCDPRLKMYEIAEKVGYQDVDYFGKVFKKHTGFTLSQYRNKATA